MGSGLARSGRVEREAIAATAAAVADQARVAREAGASEIVVVGTAAMRRARNREELASAIEKGCGIRLRVLSDADEARLAFLGATRTYDGSLRGTVAVVDVGGGSTEIALGTEADGVTWSTSVDLGSGVLAERFLAADPPTAEMVGALREEVAATLADIRVPACDTAIAVGGSATSLRRLAGAELHPEACDRAQRMLASAPARRAGARPGARARADPAVAGGDRAARRRWTRSGQAAAHRARRIARGRDPRARGLIGPSWRPRATMTWIHSRP